MQLVFAWPENQSHRVGVVPAYALMPDGRPCDATIFYKSLADG